MKEQVEQGSVQKQCWTWDQEAWTLLWICLSLTACVTLTCSLSSLAVICGYVALK